ncbi:phosphatases II [Coniophora puteana RWD-64-598 SS2]|uniref:Phosphatases II n=1 Tax=Coniophora puteana (strain RWD-64-598) TaxID=741705 RepID=A0A5M3MJX1_CONPW|nr:phosphatases II [Coniophora puteana RWD-64-598 SS2]EIW79104.1 phosphatases II [Coniophora puteana RWD-64-598 SS2]
MTSFPAASWQAALLTKQTGGRAIVGDPSYGRAATRIQNRLYLSDYWTARDAQQLRKLGITHIISLLECIPELKDHEDIKKLHIAIQDTPEADILQYLDTTTVFIKDALAENEQNKVLVHCFQGISRSATVVCAYLLATTTMVPSEAVAYVRSKRGIVSPNAGFKKQLVTYSQRFDEQRERMKLEKAQSSKWNVVISKLSLTKPTTRKRDSLVIAERKEGAEKGEEQTRSRRSFGFIPGSSSSTSNTFAMP